MMTVSARPSSVTRASVLTDQRHMQYVHIILVLKIKFHLSLIEIIALPLPPES